MTFRGVIINVEWGQGRNWAGGHDPGDWLDYATLSIMTWLNMTQGHQKRGTLNENQCLSTFYHAMVSITGFATKVTLINTPVVMKCQLIKRIQWVCKVISMQLSQATWGEGISALRVSNLQCLDFLSFETKLDKDLSRQRHQTKVISQAPERDIKPGRRELGLLVLMIFCPCQVIGNLAAFGHF